MLEVCLVFVLPAIVGWNGDNMHLDVFGLRGRSSICPASEYSSINLAYPGSSPGAAG